MLRKVLLPCYLIIAYVVYCPLLAAARMPWGGFLIDFFRASLNFLILATPLSLIAWWVHLTLNKK